MATATSERPTINIAARLRQARERRGLTQVELARKIGWPQGDVSRLESGKHSPSWDTIELYLHGLGMTPADFFGTYGQPSRGQQGELWG